MPAKPVTDALGDSIALEELKGDYAAAAAALDAAPAGADPAARADAAIWAGIVAALRSEPGAADAHLEAALTAVPDHPLGPALRHLAFGARRRLPDGHSRPAEDADLWTEPLTGDPVEAELYVLTRLPGLRTTLQLAAAVAPQNRQVVLDAGLQTLAPIWDRRPHAHRAAAELAWMAGAPALAQEHLGAATTAYSNAADLAGVASCDLVQAGWLAVSAGSPLTFGFALWESRGTSTSEQQGGFDRSLLPVPDAAASADAYQRAEDGFRAAGAARGIAMVDLHRAGVAALHDDPATALEAAERARTASERAGDLAAAQLAAAHAALAGIQAGALPERTDVATQIGSWGLESGSFGWAFGIGKLFSLVGWRWLRRDADPDRALACHRLAEAAYTALGAPDFAQQTLADRALAHDASGNWEAALVAGDAALRMFPELQAQHPEWSEELGLREGDLVTLLRSLAHPARDAGLLERLRPAVERMRAGFEAIARGEGPVADLPADLRAVLMEQAQEAARGAASDLEWDGVMVPVYRALAARQKNPLEFARQRGLALAAAAAAPDERRGRLEALLLLATGDRPAALKAFHDRPPPDPVPPGRGEMLADSVILIQLEEWPEARRRHAALEALAGRTDWWALESRPWRLLGDLARTAEGLGELEPARALYDAALVRLEGQRARLSRDDRGRFGDAQAEATLYGDAARAALAGATGPEPAAAALALAERGRARGLLSRMAGSAVLAPASPGQAAGLREWRELTGRVDVLTWLASRAGEQPTPELAAAEAALTALEARLAAENPRWLEAVAPSAATLGADEVRSALPEGSVLIEHLLVRGALLAWAVTPGAPVSARSTPTDDLAADELQRKLWTACQGKSPLWERFAEQLGELLLAPFDDAIAAAHHVILVPHRWGHVAPLHALHWRGAPLSDAKTVSVLPSASALHFLPRAAPRGGRLLAVGDPTNMSRRRPGEAAATGGFGALPWSGAQAAEAVGWFAGSPPPLLGAAAREQAVRDGLTGAQMVHFATHGVLDEAPLLACVVLADGDTLDVWELLGLPLDADLVTFSTCDSAGTPVTPGDEVVGLAWLTLAAGARAVVASLWKVSELPTALLMRAFYGALRDGRPPREALAAAQQHVKGLTRDTAAPEIAALRAAAVAAGRPDPGAPDDVPTDFSHPFYWAGFVLIGV